ncbi:hypothetical protein CUMW_286190 [Citrus unshiu]|uniref:Uncharacterized protein n=1 Tax=Citrus unshiu TaxID=55188 RepID=A0A2H5MUJ5_CITUN|nr:hypothetical protein CUMW_286190 [Citrus unshiu]
MRENFTGLIKIDDLICKQVVMPPYHQPRIAAYSNSSSFMSKPLDSWRRFVSETHIDMDAHLGPNPL